MIDPHKDVEASLDLNVHNPLSLEEDVSHFPPLSSYFITLYYYSISLLFLFVCFYILLLCVTEPVESVLSRWRDKANYHSRYC